MKARRLQHHGDFEEHFYPPATGHVATPAALIVRSIPELQQIITSISHAYACIS